MENKSLTINDKSTKPVEEQKNVPPHWFTRIASGVIDCGLLIFLLFVFISVFSMTPLGDAVNGYRDEIRLIQKDYALKPLIEGSDETYASMVYVDETNKDKYVNSYQYTDDDGKKFVLVRNDSEDAELQKKLSDAFTAALQKDKKYEAAEFNFRFVQYGLNMSAVCVSQAILFLIVPLISKKRATIGQYLAGHRCINSKFVSPARWWKILIKYAWVFIIETALPWLGILGSYSIIVIPIILYVISLFNKDKRTLRDYISSTRIIDAKSYQPLSTHSQE